MWLEAVKDKLSVPERQEMLDCVLDFVAVGKFGGYGQCDYVRIPNPNELELLW